MLLEQKVVKIVNKLMPSSVSFLKPQSTENFRQSLITPPSFYLLRNCTAEHYTLKLSNVPGAACPWQTTVVEHVQCHVHFPYSSRNYKQILYGINTTVKTLEITRLRFDIIISPPTHVIPHSPLVFSICYIPLFSTNVQLYMPLIHMFRLPLLSSNYIAILWRFECMDRNRR